MDENIHIRTLLYVTKLIVFLKNGCIFVTLELLPEKFSHKEFLEFLFLTVEHYNQFWYNKLQKTNKWSEYQSKLPK